MSPITNTGTRFYIHCGLVSIKPRVYRRPQFDRQQQRSWWLFQEKGVGSSSPNMRAGPEKDAAPIETGTKGAGHADDDVLIQYIVLRKDLWTKLHWPLGSIVAQGCHAAVAALWLSKDDQYTSKYCSQDNLDHMRKVVLEVNGEEQLRNAASNLESAGIRYKLWMEQPEDFCTCLATAPYPKSRMQTYFKKMKLCKGLQ